VVVAIALAIGVGIAVAAQSSILGGASRWLHPLSVSFALQIAGMSVGVVWAVHARAWPEVFEVVRQWWWLPLGLVGLGVVAAIGFCSARLGTLVTLALIIAAQLVAGLVFDVVNGVTNLDMRQPTGVLLVVGGVIVLAWRP
jgi:uncharacterized membrane protein YdcZ (DUF606 family)